MTATFRGEAVTASVEIRVNWRITGHAGFLDLGHPTVMKNNCRSFVAALLWMTVF